MRDESVTLWWPLCEIVLSRKEHLYTNQRRCRERLVAVTDVEMWIQEK